LRDPLSWIPVRYKLPLTFAFLCLVAFGLGGYVVTTTARQALTQQIELRLNERAASLNLVVDQSLELLGRRVEDFASDGFIRLQLERLTGGAADEHAAVTDELARHLRMNKLPLVEEFVDALLLDSDGRPLLRVHSTESSPPTAFSKTSLWVGPLRSPRQEYPFPTFVLSTVVHSIQGNRALGFLQIVVRADIWAGNLHGVLGFRDAPGFTAHLSSQGGHSLALVPGAAGVEGDGDPLRFSSTVARTGWTLDLTVSRGILTIPVNDLVWKFLYVGLALVLLTLFLLLFPRQFLLKPLSALQDAARRVAEGDFSTRVECDSRDEVGDLARGFNFMTTAIEERTRKLSKSAEVLERRETEVRYERDRLNAVIRSMEDGLFILDSSGQVTLCNASARPVIEELSRAGTVNPRTQCRKQDQGVGDCFQCIADFSNDVQGCLVTVGSKVYEINGTALPGPKEAAVGKIFVSRDVSTRVRRAEQEAHQERLSVLGEIAAVMAHELNNPLAAISMFSQMLRKGLDTGSGLRSHAEVIHRNAESCKTTIRSLLDMATTPTSEFTEFDVEQLILDVRQLLEPVARRAGTQVSIGARAENPMAFGDELQLRHALVNLVMNAVQALQPRRDGKVVMESENRGEELAIIVRDNGPGIAEEIRERIFEPFFTTKAPGDGTGLGLPTSRRIVDAQGGRLQLLRTDGEGTVFEILIPRARFPQAAPRPVRLHVVGQPREPS